MDPPISTADQVVYYSARKDRIIRAVVTGFKQHNKYYTGVILTPFIDDLEDWERRGPREVGWSRIRRLGC